MAITQKGPGHREKMLKGVLQIIAGAFSTTDTTGTIVTDLNRVRCALFSLFPASNLAAAESLCIYGATVDSAGFIVVPTNKTLNVGRVGASVTSGLKFSVLLEGF